ncbi:glycosyltransferase family 2 protein [Rhizobium sp. RAF36]|uniref:glycosyltransferase family 2 protein n=1 Tax=Rhizobium sp. RAF36 TaxID=3233055 RepID=UPI003F948F2C
MPVRDRIAYVVPTKDRPDDLRKLFESLRKQEDAPDQVIIVDASEPPVKTICDEYSDLPLTYVREYPPSLARQRNAGMAALEESITIAGYLDDDLELEPDATGRMRAFWNAAGTDIGGAAFTIVNQPLRSSAFGAVADFFLLNAKRQGQLLRSGFASSIAVPSENTETDWLYGGATLWRRSVIEQHRYDEWYIGHGFLEDVDYSYRVSREHRLWVVAGARVWHWPRPVMASRQFTLGVQQVVNRIYFTRKMRTFSALALSWALFGQCVFNIAQSIQQRESSGFRRFLGNLKGFTLIMGGKLNSVDGIWK